MAAKSVDLAGAVDLVVLVNEEEKQRGSPTSSSCREWNVVLLRPSDSRGVA